MYKQQAVALEPMLENGHWVRNLARQLLYDKSLTDDVVQEVWIKALERPPSKPQALQAWLKQVVRSVALRANRTASRRQRRESQAEAGTRPPTPAEIVEQLDTQNHLATAVKRLKEPYRTTVFLHYYHELKLAEIGAATGVPSSTVRTRLSRGLELLRSQLDSDFGARQRWKALLLPLAVSNGWVAGMGEAAAAESLHALASNGVADSTALTTATSPHAGVAKPMVSGGSTSAVAWVLATLVIVGLAAVVRYGVSTAARESARSAVADARTSAQLALGSQELVSPVVEPLVSQRARTTIAAVPRAHLRVTDRSSGAEVPGAHVYLVRVTDVDSTAVGETDADGLLSVSSDVLSRDSLLVLADGYVEHREPATLRNLSEEPYSIELEPVFSATVRVLKPDGSPASGVAIRVQGVLRGLPPPAADEIVTDASGVATYVSRHYDAQIHLDVEGFATVAIPAVTPTTEIRLRPARSVTGVVRDEAGRPLSGGPVEIEGNRHRRCRDDSEE